MIQINDPKECCGCNACKSVCPKNCISMKVDAEGFWYPDVDTNLCINCHLCEQVCPILHPESENQVVQTLSVISKSENVRAASSSGGVFTGLAKHILNNGGVVYGCALDENLNAKHIRVENESGLLKLQSSKYVQSQIGDTFKDALKDLKAGRPVLFSGTGCHIAGFKRFLRKNYDNLLLIDVLCHGVPSPQLYRDHLTYLSKKYDSKPIAVNFRDKRKGWKRLYITVDFANGKRYSRFSGFDPYMSLFLNNMSQRPSCFECPFNTTERPGDISLGDFWGIGRVKPKYDDNKGIGLVLVNNERGAKFIEKIKNEYTICEETLDLAIAGNKVLKQHITGYDRQNQFYNMYISEGYRPAIDKFAPPTPLWKRGYYALMRFGFDIVRKILGKGF